MFCLLLFVSLFVNICWCHKIPQGGPWEYQHLRVSKKEPVQSLEFCQLGSQSFPCLVVLLSVNDSETSEWPYSLLSICTACYIFTVQTSVFSPCAFTTDFELILPLLDFFFFFLSNPLPYPKSTVIYLFFLKTKVSTTFNFSFPTQIFHISLPGLERPSSTIIFGKLFPLLWLNKSVAFSWEWTLFYPFDI